MGTHDSTSRANVVLTHLHHEGHEGMSFYASAADASMANTDTLVLAFKVPTGTVLPHFAFEFASLGAIHIDLLEGTVWTAGSGSQSPLYNRKRSSSNSSVLQEDTAGSFSATDNFVLNPTITDAGTAIRTVHAFAERPFDGVEEIGGEEWILNSNTTYALRLTADAGSNAGYISCFWYEHADQGALD